jgi:hypothetical protein
VDVLAVDDLAPLVVVDFVLVVDAVVDAAVAVGDGIVPMGCEAQDAKPEVLGAWRPAYVATN